MSHRTIDVRVYGPSALRVEYERDDVGSRRDGRVGNRLNDADAERLVSIFGPGFSEELPRAAAVDPRAVHNDVRTAPVKVCGS